MKNTILIGFLGFIACGIALTPAAGWAESKSVEITVSARVLPMFEISVSGPAGGNIAFGDISKKSDQPVTVGAQDVFVEARSNLRKPYQITQTLVQPFSNAEGDGTFDPDDFTVRAASASGKGSAANGARVGTSPTELYVSDSEGRSETIKANYQLRVKPNQPSGDYRTRLVYSITTL